MLFVSIYHTSLFNIIEFFSFVYISIMFFISSYLCVVHMI